VYERGKYQVRELWLQVYMELFLVQEH